MNIREGEGEKKILSTWEMTSAGEALVILKLKASGMHNKPTPLHFECRVLCTIKIKNTSIHETQFATIRKSAEFIFASFLSSFLITLEILRL